MLEELRLESGDCQASALHADIRLHSQYPYANQQLVLVLDHGLVMVFSTLRDIFIVDIPVTQ